MIYIFNFSPNRQRMDSMQELQAEIFDARGNFTDGQYIKIFDLISKVNGGIEQHRALINLFLRDPSNPLKSFLLIYFFNGDSDANATILENRNLYKLLEKYSNLNLEKKNKRYYSKKLKESLKWMKSKKPFCRQMVRKLNSKLLHFTISINNDNNLVVKIK